MNYMFSMILLGPLDIVRTTLLPVQQEGKMQSAKTNKSKRFVEIKGLNARIDNFLNFYKER